MPLPDRPVIQNFWVAGRFVVEAAPTHCPAGHPLGADRVLVGALPCLCPVGWVKSHRTWRCLEPGCDRQWIRPRCVDRDDPEWLG